MSTVYRCIVCNTTYDNNTDAQNCYYEHVENKEPIPFVRHKNSTINPFLEEATKKVFEKQHSVLKKLADYEEKAKKANEKGLKYDSEKPDLSILPIEALELMARAFMYGAKKYHRDNYKKGLEVTRTLAAALRHIYAFLNKTDNDNESGVNHLGHALAAIAMTCYNIKHNKDMDDR